MEKRTEKLSRILNELNIDGLFITDLYNLRYFTGFTGTTGVALATKNGNFFFSDFRYKTQATKQVSDVVGLPDRVIGGERAVGYSNVYTEADTSKVYETWFVGRHDGLWRFTLNSAPGESAVPSEARAALDTVSWGPPESAIPTVRES